ncbi:MAG: hypothetical protein RIT45_1488 [Pseudomonadota bacterium]|jgi:SSS family solute:Na+ symporter/sodium/pantothenate symporter
MNLFELMANDPLVWGLFAVYLVGTSYLAWLGHKKTDDIESFAVGKGDMHPAVVGVTLAASIASAATFVLNPGLVYLFGVSALMHLGVAAAGGVIVGLFVLSFGFRRVGAEVRAITLPQWMGQRYGSRGMTVFFAALNLLSITFMVLIVAGLAIVMQLTLGLSNTASVLLIIGFVFSYIFLGGTYAHAYTNTLQGVIMVGIATILVASGWDTLAGGWEGVTTRLATIDPNLALTANPKSPLYASTFSVWISGFVIGFGLVCQPHILTKALYVRSDRQVAAYLGVATVISVIFTALLLIGLYARLGDIPADAFLDAATGRPKADAVVTVYIQHTFGPGLRAVIAVALLAAGMSTLDGILVALSTITANDLYLELGRDRWLKGLSPAAQSKAAHRASQIILILLGLATLVISLDPPALISIFGQIGVFAIAAGSTPPILFGIFAKGMPGRVAFGAALLSTGTYVGLSSWGRAATSAGENLNAIVQGWGPLAHLFDTAAPQLGLLNPAVPAAYGILIGVLVCLPFAFRRAEAAR